MHEVSCSGATGSPHFRQGGETEQLGVVSGGSSRHFETLLDATRTGQWSWEFASGRISWSPGLGPLHGRPRGWQPSSYDEFRSLVHHEDWPQLHEVAQRARVQGEGYELEFRVVFPDGSVRWLWTRADVVHDGEARLVGLTRDVTERHRRDESERFLARASQVLLATESAADALQLLCETAVGKVADWCAVERVSGRRVEVLAFAGRRPEEERYVLDAQRQQVVQSGASLLVEVPTGSLASERDRVVLSPVLTQDGLVEALLVLGSAAPSRAFDDHDVALAEALGRRIAVALERSRLLGREALAAQRTVALQRVTALLSAAATAEEVVRVGIEEGLATMGASGGSIAYPQDASTMKRVTAGYAPQDAGGSWAVVPFDAELPGPMAARTGNSLWLSDRASTEQRFPLVREVFAHTPWTSLCALPLPAGELRGFFVAFFSDARSFDDEERAFTEAIVTLCAQALDRARLLDAAERARDRARGLQAVTAALSMSATPVDVGEAIVRDGLAPVGAVGLIVYVDDEEGAKLVASVGYDDSLELDWGLIPHDADTPVTHVLRHDETLVFESPEDARRRFPVLRNVPRRGDRSAVLAPMSVTNTATGVLCASFDAGHAVTDDDVRFVEALARLSAQALERAKLLDAERVTSDRLSRLQRVTAKLGAAMTIEEIGRIIVNEGVAAVNGAAGALVLDTVDGNLELVEANGFGEELVEMYRRFSPDEPVVAAEVYRAGAPRWVESLEQMESTYPQRELELDPHLQAEAYVPLRVAGSTIGVLVISFEGSRRLSTPERDLLITLGRQCAQAIANARVFAREHRIAETLQHDLLPQSIVVPPSVVAAARYMPGSGEADIGGDWYDLVERPDGRVGGSVGDVAGKGVLAASRMGQLRTAQRAHCLAGLSPSDVVAQMNMLVEATDSFLATLVAFDLEPATGELRFCVAGHPPPVLLRADGTSTIVRGAESLPLGVGLDSAFAESSTVLEPGDVVVFFTDGLIERRGVTLEEATRLVCAELEACAGHDPEALVERVLDAVLRQGPTQDDIVLLALGRAA